MRFISARENTFLQVKHRFCREDYRAFLSSYLHPRRRVLASIAAGVVGSAINWFPVDFPGGVHLTFGGIFSLIVALTLGPAYGALTALIAELPGLVHPFWRHRSSGARAGRRSWSESWCAAPSSPLCSGSVLVL